MAVRGRGALLGVLAVVPLLAGCPRTVPDYVPGAGDGGSDRGTQLVTVRVAGLGHGRVVSSAGPTTCDASGCVFWAAVGGQVTVTAVPDDGSTFLGWSGACQGTGSCELVIDGRSVSAHFGKPGAWSVALDAAALGVAVTPEGDVVLLGSAATAVQLGAGSVGPGLFLARFGADGQVLWARAFRRSGGVVGRRSLVVDGAGRIFTAYAFLGDVEPGVGSFTSWSRMDLLVASYGPDGEPRWAKSFGGTTEEGSAGIALDDGGNLVVAGSMDREFSMDDFLVKGDLLSPSSRSYVAKLSPEGAVLWARALQMDALAVAGGAGGAAYVAGRGGSPGGTSTSLPPSVRLVRLRSDGTVDWTSDLPVDAFSMDNAPAGVVTDGLGAATVVGWFFGSVGGFRPAGDFPRISPFMAGFGSDGASAWVRAWFVPWFSTLNDVALDGAGNLYAVGSTQMGPVTLGEGVGVAGDGVDPRGFLARFTPLGDAVEAHSFGPAEPLSQVGLGVDAERVAVNARGVSVLQGRFYVPADFGDALRSPLHPGNLYLVRFPAPP